MFELAMKNMNVDRTTRSVVTVPGMFVTMKDTSPDLVRLMQLFRHVWDNALIKNAYYGNLQTIAF